MDTNKAAMLYADAPPRPVTPTPAPPDVTFIGIDGRAALARSMARRHKDDLFLSVETAPLSVAASERALACVVGVVNRGGASRVAIDLTAPHEVDGDRATWRLDSRVAISADARGVRITKPGDFGEVVEIELRVTALWWVAQALASALHWFEWQIVKTDSAMHRAIEPTEGK